MKLDVNAVVPEEVRKAAEALHETAYNGSFKLEAHDFYFAEFNTNSLNIDVDTHVIGCAQRDAFVYGVIFDLSVVTLFETDGCLI